MLVVLRSHNEADKMPHVVRPEAALLKICVMDLHFFLLIPDIQDKMLIPLYFSFPIDLFVSSASEAFINGQ